MRYSKDFDSYKPWAGAVGTYEKIVDAGKLDKLEMFLEEHFNEEIPTETDINDLLWFDSDYILECLRIPTNEEEEH